MEHDAGGGGGSPDIELDSTWPGLTPPAADEMEMDPEVLLSVAQALQSQANFLRTDAAGTPMKLRAATAIPSGETGNWFGRWDTAADMETSFVYARDYIAWFYEELAAQLEAMAGQARAAATQAEGTDAANLATFTGQEASLGPPTGPVQVP